jgi:phosphoglycolate phosphatase
MTNYRHQPIDRLEAVVFDLDGTLVDSAQDIASGLNHALAEEKLRSVPLADVRAMIGDGVRALAVKALRWQDMEPEPAIVDRILQSFLTFSHAAPVQASTLFPGVEHMILTLRKAGIKIGICTNKQHGLALRVVEALRLGPLTDQLVGGGEFAMKPDPAPLLATIQRLSASPSAAIYVGDMRVDFLTAIAADVAFLGIDHGDWNADLTDLPPPVIARGADELGGFLLETEACAALYEP